MGVMSDIALQKSIVIRTHEGVLEELDISDFISDEELKNFDMDTMCLSYSCYISKYEKFTGNLAINYQLDDGDFVRVHIELSQPKDFHNNSIELTLEVEDVHDPVYKRVSEAIKKALELLSLA
jgi:hypothetical protein